MNIIKRRLQGLSQEAKNNKWIPAILFIINFADASVIPLPAQAFLLIVILGNPARTFRYLTVCFLGAFAGAIAGYMIGWLAAGSPSGETSLLLKFLYNGIPGFSETAYHKIQSQFSEFNLWVLISAAVTPIPYGMFAVASGLFRIDFVSFSVLTLLSQALKFYVVTFIVAKIGQNAFGKIRLYLRSFTTIVLVCITIAILVS